MAAASTFSFHSEPEIGPVKTKTKNVVFMAALRVISLPSFLAAWIAAFTYTYSAAFGQDAKTAEALRLITETAAQICQTAPLEQTNTGYELSGEAKAKVGGLVGKIADLSISGGGSAQSGHSVGVLEKDLPSVILSTHNCKLQVFLTLERDLLGEHTKKSAPGIEPEDNVSELPVNFSIPNSEQYCLRLKKIIDSAKKSFEPIIGILDEFIGGFKPKVELPDMEWCYINTLSVGKKGLYYSCLVFMKEKSISVADGKFSAYIAVTAGCLGKDWLKTDATRSKPEKRTYFKREPEDPTVVLKSSREKEEGADLAIYVNQP